MKIEIRSIHGYCRHCTTCRCRHLNWHGKLRCLFEPTFYLWDLETPFRCNRIPQYDNPLMVWNRMLRALDGIVLDVETKYLFKDQFNTAPLPARQRERILRYIQREYPGMQIQEVRTALKAGLRIMDSDVGRVIDDIRTGLQRCNYCGKTSDTAFDCPHCNSPTKYLEVF